MKLLHTSLTVAAALTCLPALADDLCPLVTELNQVLVDRTDYSAIPCPAIGFTALDSQPGMRSQAGAYFPETGRIELAPDLRMETAYGQGFLSHEMVHAAQFAEGADSRVPCTAALEAEAYLVQAQFLHDAGLTRDALFTRMLGEQLGTCGAQPDY
jgi:hypothetical protein